MEIGPNTKHMKAISIFEENQINLENWKRKEVRQGREAHEMQRKLVIIGRSNSLSVSESS